MKPRFLAIAVIAVCIVQGAALAHMIHDRFTLLRDGEEIVLKTVPVDPRSLFRGHYVRLNYSVSTVPVSLWTGDRDPWRLGEQTVYVELDRDDKSQWQPVGVHMEFPSAKTGTRVLRGRMTHANRTSMFVRYGLERFYLPKDKAQGLEMEYRDDSVEVVAAVDPDTGEAAIKALIVVGNRVHEERMF